jgi:hypothetical protein
VWVVDSLPLLVCEEWQILGGGRLEKCTRGAGCLGGESVLVPFSTGAVLDQGGGKYDDEPAEGSALVKGTGFKRTGILSIGLFPRSGEAGFLAISWVCTVIAP